MSGKATIKINVSRLPDVGYHTPTVVHDPEDEILRQRALEKAQLEKEMDEIEEAISGDQSGKEKA